MVQHLVLIIRIIDKELRLMAKPIKETPFLSGRDARTFISDNKNVSKVSTEEKREIEKGYKDLMSIAEL